MAEFELDCLGEACPVPLMKTEKKLATLAKGDTLIVHIDHSC
ncbi:MAG: sulfurtransferase TusA family protein, partial [Clostridia bacterium]